MESFTLLPPANFTQEIAYQTQSEPVEDLLYEFLRDRTTTTAASYRDDLKAFFEFTAKYFQLPRGEGSRVHFEDISLNATFFSALRAENSFAFAAKEL